MSISFVQGKNFTFTTASSYVNAYTSNVTAGDLLIAAFQIGNTTATYSCADTQTNVYSLAVSVAANGAQNGIFWAIAKTTGACTVTITSSASTSGGVCLAEYTLASLLGSGASANGSAGGSTSLTTPNITTTVANAVVIGFLTGNVLVQTGAFTTRAALNSSGHNFFAISDDIVSSTGTYTDTSTQTGTGAANGGICYFYAASGSHLLGTLGVGQ